MKAPWHDHVVTNLNLQQLNLLGGFPTHPYTCGNRGDGRHGTEGGDLGVLIATAEGWVCPHCSYTQDWAEPPSARVDLVGMIGPNGFEQIGLTRDQQRAVAEQKLAAYEALAARDARGAAAMVSALRPLCDDLENEPAERSVMSMWTVYERPSDFPHHFVARRFEIDGHDLRPTNDTLHALTLDGLREKAPPGLSNIPRSPHDDPCIVECWL